MTTPPPTAADARNQLYDIVRRDVSFETKARNALEVGVEFLDADLGYLTQIDRDTEYREIRVSTADTGDLLSTGHRFAHALSSCQSTRDVDKQITLNDAPNHARADNPADENRAVARYHGTLLVDDEPYGTVCFVAVDTRESFTDCETMFAELVTHLLERQLERDQHEAELTRQADLATVLNRVLRHNLRNKLSVVRGYTQLMTEELSEDSAGETALANIDDLIELCQKARELDEIVAADSAREPTELTTLISTVAARVADAYPEASVSVGDADPIWVSVLPGFERAVSELVENAAKHGGTTPTVTVGIEPTPAAVDIRITDEGPGLEQHEVDVLETGSETPLIHGSGLGLWLTHWIVTSHDGTVDATVSEAGTMMTISVPRTPKPGDQPQRTPVSRTHNLYRSAFEAASDAILLTDTSGRIVETNPAAAALFGTVGRTLLGRKLREFLHDDLDFEAEWTAFEAAGLERDTVTLVGVDGGERLVEYSGTTHIVPGQHLFIAREVTLDDSPAASSGG